MRKFLAIFLIAATMLCLFGCTQDPTGNTDPIQTPTDPSSQITDPPVTSPSFPDDPDDETDSSDPTDPDDTTGPTGPTEPAPTLGDAELYGIDVSGMTSSQVKSALRKKINSYKLSLTINSEPIVFSAKDLGMSLSSEHYYKWFDETLDGNTADTTGLIKYDISKAISKVSAKYAKKPVNATISYNDEKFIFEIKPHEDGIQADIASVEKALVEALSTFAPRHSVTIAVEPLEAEIQSDDPRLNGLIKEANEYLDLDISYTYNPKNLPSYTETISRGTIASFITVYRDLSVEIDMDAVLRFVASKSADFSGSAKRGFTTSYGTVINLDVEYYDNTIDQAAMYADLMNCLTNKITPYKGTANFLDAEDSNMAYGGNYIEIDLNNQCLWLYKDGLLVTSSPLTSGTVLYGYCTPTGVYAIKKKSTCVTLTGPTWASYVTYWMPFSGPYGLHDATWRTNFGGTTYLKDGSHGCINLPFEKAEIIFNNIKIGTKVIIYGGAKTMDPMEQGLYGKSSYSLTTSNSVFNLNIKKTFQEPVLTYQSSNENVVTVDAEGNVTVVGAGEATISVVSPAIGYVSEATFTVSIVVTGDPIESEPEETDPEETTPDETEPEPTEPEPTEPETTVPEETDPVVTEPVTTAPEATESMVS